MAVNYNAEPILRVEHMKQYFKISSSFTVKDVDDVSFEIYPGETYGLYTEQPTYAANLWVDGHQMVKMGTVSVSLREMPSSPVSIQRMVMPWVVMTTVLSGWAAAISFKASSARACT